MRMSIIRVLVGISLFQVAGLIGRQTTLMCFRAVIQPEEEKNGDDEFFGVHPDVYLKDADNRALVELAVRTGRCGWLLHWGGLALAAAGAVGIVAPPAARAVAWLLLPQRALALRHARGADPSPGPAHDILPPSVAKCVAGAVLFAASWAATVHVGSVIRQEERAYVWSAERWAEAGSPRALDWKGRSTRNYFASSQRLGLIAAMLSAASDLVLISGLRPRFLPPTPRQEPPCDSAASSC